VLAPSVPILLLSSFAVGCATSTIQMLVPSAAGLTSASRRGRVIGNVMSGLMIGILLSRPLASVLAEYAGWRGAYGVEAIGIVALLVALYRVLPHRMPKTRATYGMLITSLFTLLAVSRYYVAVQCRRRCAWARSASSGRRFRCA
jgi:predicted MFS family arabinose efflux permease